MILYLCNPPKHPCLPVYCHHVRAVVNLFGIENVPNDYLVTIHRGTDTRDRSVDSVVLGDLVRPDELATVLLDGKEVAAPIGEINCVTIYGRSGRDIATGCEDPFGR